MHWIDLHGGARSQQPAPPPPPPPPRDVAMCVCPPSFSQHALQHSSPILISTRATPFSTSPPAIPMLRRCGQGISGAARAPWACSLAAASRRRRAAGAGAGRRPAGAAAFSQEAQGQLQHRQGVHPEGRQSEAQHGCGGWPQSVQQVAGVPGVALRWMDNGGSDLPRSTPRPLCALQTRRATSARRGASWASCSLSFRRWAATTSSCCDDVHCAAHTRSAAT